MLDAISADCCILSSGVSYLNFVFLFCWSVSPCARQLIAVALPPSLITARDHRLTRRENCKSEKLILISCLVLITTSSFDHASASSDCLAILIGCDFNFSTLACIMSPSWSITNHKVAQRRLWDKVANQVQTIIADLSPARAHRAISNLFSAVCVGCFPSASSSSRALAILFSAERAFVFRYRSWLATDALASRDKMRWNVATGKLRWDRTQSKGVSFCTSGINNRSQITWASVGHAAHKSMSKSRCIL